MENNDWDEIKKYSEKYEKEKIDKYGINLNEQLDKIIQKKNNNKDKYKKKVIKISLKTALIIIFTIILLPFLFQVFLVIMDAALGFSSFARN